MLDENGRSYIVKMKKNLFCFYYDNATECIECRRYEKGKWLFYETAAKEVTGDFTLSLSEENEMLLCVTGQDGTGWIYTKEDGAWKRQVMKLTQVRQLLQIHLLADKDSVYAIYARGSEVAGIPGGRQILIHRIQDAERGEERSIADNVVVPANDRAGCLIRHIGRGYYILCYRTGGNENTLGYKAFALDGKSGDFQALYKTKYPIADFSILPEGERLHCSFVIKGPHTAQLVYRNKFGKDLCEPVVIFEGSRVEHSCLMVYENRIHVFFLAGSYGYYHAYSEDGGRSFSRPQRMRRGYGVRHVRAEYIDADGEGRQEAHCLSSLYIEVENPAAASYLEEIYPEFYRMPMEEPTIVQEKPQIIALNPSQTQMAQDERVNMNYPEPMPSFPSEQGGVGGEFDLLQMDEEQMRRMFLKQMEESRVLSGEKREIDQEEMQRILSRRKPAALAHKLPADITKADIESLSAAKNGSATENAVKDTGAHISFEAQMENAAKELAMAGASEGSGVGGMGLGMSMSGGSSDFGQKPIAGQLRQHKEEISILENKLAQLEHSLLEKNQQLMEMSLEMSRRSEEYGKATLEWQAEILKLQERAEQITKPQKAAIVPRRRTAEKKEAADGDLMNKSEKIAQDKENVSPEKLKKPRGRKPVQKSSGIAKKGRAE